MKIKISYTEEERVKAGEIEAAIQDILDRPRIKKVDSGSQFKQTYLTTKISEKLL